MGKKPVRASYYVNLDERGLFYADVRVGGCNGRTIFDVHEDDLSGLIEDGFLRSKHDIDGLEAHLIALGILGAGASLTRGE